MARPRRVFRHIFLNITQINSANFTADLTTLYNSILYNCKDLSRQSITAAKLPNETAKYAFDALFLRRHVDDCSTKKHEKNTDISDYCRRKHCAYNCGVNKSIHSPAFLGSARVGYQDSFFVGLDMRSLWPTQRYMLCWLSTVINSPNSLIQQMCTSKHVHVKCDVLQKRANPLSPYFKCFIPLEIFVSSFGLSLSDLPPAIEFIVWNSLTTSLVPFIKKSFHNWIEPHDYIFMTLWVHIRQVIYLSKIDNHKYRKENLVFILSRMPPYLYFNMIYLLLPFCYMYRCV